MSIFMSIVNQAAELAKGRGRISFVIDLEKWIPMRSTQSQPEDTWRVAWFESVGAGAARASAKGRDAQEALVRVVAAMSRGQSARGEEAADLSDAAAQARDVLEALAEGLRERSPGFGEISGAVDRALKLLKAAT